MQPPSNIPGFIARWSAASASERSNSQLFLTELCDVLGVPHPDADQQRGYAFEFPVAQLNRDGTITQGRIDSATSNAATPSLPATKCRK
jgi:hypothetical protein